MVPIFSTTKGVTAMAIALQHSRGRIDFDEKVSAYWPDFAQNGKEDVTVRQLIGHECGLAGPSPPIALATLSDKDATRDFFAQVKMEWDTPGDKKGYMAVTLGNYESCIIQMTDEQAKRGEPGRTAGQYLRDEIFIPLGVEGEIYVGLPKDIPDDRFAQLDGMSGIEPLFCSTYPAGFMRKLLLQPSTYTARAFANPRLAAMPGVMDFNRRDIKEVEFPGTVHVHICSGVCVCVCLGGLPVLSVCRYVHHMFSNVSKILLKTYVRDV